MKSKKPSLGSDPQYDKLPKTHRTEADRLTAEYERNAAQIRGYKATCNVALASLTLGLGLLGIATLEANNKSREATEQGASLEEVNDIHTEGPKSIAGIVLASIGVGFTSTSEVKRRRLIDPTQQTLVNVEVCFINAGVQGPAWVNDPKNLNL